MIGIVRLGFEKLLAELGLGMLNFVSLYGVVLGQLISDLSFHIFASINVEFLVEGFQVLAI